MKGGVAARVTLKWGAEGRRGEEAKRRRGEEAKRRRWVIYKGWDFWYNGR